MIPRAKIYKASLLNQEFYSTILLTSLFGKIRLTRTIKEWIIPVMTTKVVSLLLRKNFSRILVSLRDVLNVRLSRLMIIFANEQIPKLVDRISLVKARHVQVTE